MNILHKWALRIITKYLRNKQATVRLTAQYLEKKGWVKIKEGDRIYWTEAFVKDRDKIWITFDLPGCYRVWHGPDKTFIALESNLVWFEIYFMLLDRY